MSDLISRKALLSVFEEQKSKTTKLHELFFFDAVMAIIDNQPTAYDADKVVEQLKQMKARYFLTIANTGNEILDKIYEEVGNSIDKAIVIVKGGSQGE